MIRVAPELYYVTLRLNAIIFVMSAIPTLSTLIVSVGQSQRHFMHCRHCSPIIAMSLLLSSLKMGIYCSFHGLWSIKVITTHNFVLN